MLLLLLACHTIQKIEPDSVAVAEAAACGGDIYVPLSGYDVTVPVLADLDAATFGASPNPAQIHLSWANDPSSSQAILWRTDYDTLSTQVEFGTDATYGFVVTGASYGLGGTATYGRVHEAHLCGLLPATTYHYRVGGTDHWSGDHTFTTAPLPGDTGRFSFVVTGDSRDNQAVWGEILAASAAHDPAFYVFSGDAVDIGSNMDEWDAWFNNGEGYLEQKPVVLVHGNHEFQAQQFFALTAQPLNELWFSLDYGDAHFVVLNDTAASTEIEEQAQWMATDLAATTRNHRFAFHHQPAYSSCTTHGGNATLAELWSPVEEAGGVAIDFAGHNHNYERSVPLRAGQESTDGVTYVVSAGAGAGLYGNDLSQTYTAVAAVVEHYTLVTVEEDRIELTAYDLSGNVIDSWDNGG